MLFRSLSPSLFPPTLSLSFSLPSLPLSFSPLPSLLVSVSLWLGGEERRKEGVLLCGRYPLNYTHDFTNSCSGLIGPRCGALEAVETPWGWGAGRDGGDGGSGGPGLPHATTATLVGEPA